MVVALEQAPSRTRRRDCVPTITVVGLPEAAVQESRERVRAAVKNAGCVFPMRRVTVNLAPVDLKKEGPLLLTDCPVLP